MVLTLRLGREPPGGGAFLDVGVGDAGGAEDLGEVEGVRVRRIDDPSVGGDFFENDFPPDLQRLCCRVLASAWPLPGPAPLPSAGLPPWLAPPPPGREAAFFPGTFDPWHEGHTQCVLLADAGHLVVAPDRNPWKQGAPAAEPFAVLRGVPRGLLAGGGRSLYTGFLGKGGPNPTSGWARGLPAPWAALVMGDDGFLGLDRWRDAGALLAGLRRVVVVPRGAGEGAFEEQRARIQGMAPGLVVERRAGHPFEGASSRARRGG